MSIQSLKKKISRGDYDVEDILMVAKYPSENTANELLGLARENKWKRNVSGRAGIPFGDWVDVVVEYCLNGLSGLEDMVARDDRVTFVLSLLSEIGSLPALNTAETILLNDYDRFMKSEIYGNKIIGTLNLIAFSQKTKILNSQNVSEVREFLHKFLETTISDSSAGITFCALRFYGDNTSIPIIKQHPPIPDHWEDTRKSALSFIRRRLAKSKN